MDVDERLIGGDYERMAARVLAGRGYRVAELAGKGPDLLVNKRGSSKVVMYCPPRSETKRGGN
jgi:hypothetical protein